MRSHLGALRTSGPVQAATLLLPVVALLIVALAAGSRPARSQALSVSIDDVTVTEGDTGTTQATFTVSLSAADPVSVSVQFATADGTAQSGEDFVAASGTLTLSGSVRIRQVSVDIIGDTVAEDDETFTVVLSNPMGAPIADGEGIGTITDDDDDGPPPVTGDDAAATPFETAVTIDVLANDSGDGLAVTQVTQPPNGAAVVNGDGTITYTPDGGFSGLDSFTYTVTDDDSQTDTATVRVLVGQGQPATPLTAGDDAATTPQNTAVTIAVLANDTGDGLAVSSATQPTNGTAVVNADATITYTPAAAFSGLDSFTYTVTDDDSQTDTATVRVLVGPGAPDIPINAVNDAATTPFNTAVTIDVLVNDTGEGIEVTGASDPPNGAAVVNGDGTITYTPNAGFSGPNSFTYTITDDDGDTDTATVTVTVLPSPMGDIIVGTPTVNGQPAGSAPGPTVTVGDPITIAVPVTNSSDTAVTDLGGTSPLGSLTCAVTTLAAGASTTCTVAGTAAAGPQQVSITIVATAAGETVTDMAVAFYTGMSAPPGDIAVGTPTVNGQPAASPPGPTVTEGSQITIAVPVTNTGEVAVSNLTGTSGIGTLACATMTLAAGASTTCTGTGTAAAGPQSVPITITALGANGQPVSAAMTAFYAGRQGAPTITGVTPPSGPTTGNTTATISGSGFQQGATVSFGGTAASGASCTAAGTQCTATTPPHAPGPVAVTVTNPDQQTATLAGGFTYIAPAPIVTSVTPTSGPEAGGTAVTIIGTDLTDPLGPTTVTFGGTPATNVHCPSPTQCQTVSPLGRGTVSVRVTVGGQTSPDTAAATFTYEPPPQPMTVTGQAWRQIPPLVSEGQTEPTIVPVVGGVVEALIGGVVCGQGVTDSQGRASLLVAADPPAQGCGRDGVAISFRVNGAAAAGDPLSFRSGGQAAVTLILPGPMPPPRR